MNYSIQCQKTYPFKFINNGQEWYREVVELKEIKPSHKYHEL
jgi:hypothetical protein